MWFYDLILCLNSNQKIKIIAETDKLTEGGRKWFHYVIYEGDAGDIPIQAMCDLNPPDIVRLEINNEILEIFVVG